MKLVWLSANASHAHTSLALPVLHLACRDLAEVSWQAVQTTGHDDPAAVAAAVSAHQPDLVASTLYLFNRRLVLDVLARVKALHPACQIVVGGPECLGDNRDLLGRHPWLDLAARGEGEAVLPELLRRLGRGEDLAGLPGLCRRTPDDGIEDDPSRAVFAAWAEAPPAYASPFFEVDRPFVALETSRGCPARCTYCTSGASAPLRCRPLPTVRTELQELRRRGVRAVRLLDRTFNAPAGRAAALLDLFLTEFPELTFHLEIDPRVLTPDLRRRFAAAPPGALHLEVGLQTTAPAALAAVGRGGDPQAALAGLRFLAQCPHLTIHVDLLAGLPRQTLTEVEADLEILLDLDLAEIQLEILKALPGTPLREQAAALGLRYAPVPPYEVLSTPSLSADGLRRIAAWSRAVDRFHNVPALRPAFRRLVCHAGGLADFAAAAAVAGLLAAPASLERRFQYLAERLSLTDPPAVALLRLAWLEAGLSPNAALCAAVPWKGPLPSQGEWLRGDRQAAAAATARLWHLALPEARYWFVYDRRVSPHQPIACLRQA